MNYLDLNAKVIFKVKLGEEIKKTLIHNEDIDYNDLLLMVQRIFSEKIKPNDELSIKYVDDEGDLITITSDADVKLAIQSSKTVKLEISLKSDDECSKKLNADGIVEELKRIRSGINTFIDKMDHYVSLKNADSRTAISSQNSFSADSLREFDPFNSQRTSDNFKSDQPVQTIQNASSSNNLTNPGYPITTTSALFSQLSNQQPQTPFLNPNVIQPPPLILGGLNQTMSPYGLSSPQGIANPFSKASGNLYSRNQTPTFYKQGYS